jgi:hypothetical protein
MPTFASSRGQYDAADGKSPSEMASPRPPKSARRRRMAVMMIVLMAELSARHRVPSLCVRMCVQLSLCACECVQEFTRTL